MSAVDRPQAAMMLCDFAQVADGKLYILGGGWSQINMQDPDAPVFVTLAVDLSIPWDLANRPIPIAVDLVTEDYEPFVPRGEEEPLRMEGGITVGRPPWARAGVPLHIPLVFPFPPIFGLQQGGYVVRLFVDGNDTETAPFQIVPA